MNAAQGLDYSTFGTAAKKADRHVRRCINGVKTGCNKCVAYCRYDGHPGFLTEKQRKEHNCIEKGCHYYVAKERANEPRHKNECEAYLQLIKSIIENSRTISEGVRVVRVEHTLNLQYTAYYVTITNQYSFASCSKFIQDKLGIQVDFSRLQYDFDACAALFLR